MYNKNLPGRADLTPEFEDGVKTFIKWAKSQPRHMDGDRIRGARYKPSREQDPHQKKSPNAILTYLPITPHLQRLYSSRPTARAHDGMPHIRQRRGRCVIHPMPRTYDHATNWAFIMQAALMWTVNDLPAYGMTSKWSTAGVMGCPEKTKDNMNARKDLKIICNRLELELDTRRSNVMPKVVYTLGKEQYSVSIILCNLEKIFLPAFFDSMEHLIVHLMNDARIRGPVQYRWMYPFERFLRELKKKVKNKAHVEASIVESYMSKKSACLLHSTLRQTCNPNEARLEEIMSARAAMIDSRCLFSIILAELVVLQRKHGSVDQNGTSSRRTS
ncbi:hypothetical protein Sango_2429600 [Sesamum angolense]|uniref:DUF4218 domain-containing protein n=1 Tax=Sesamum angolense TaxID=2727404 RepID=A0AAE1W7K3_9LAMI|nr:hypothetical protein Sango_2429600 [Sesamum angolense]